MSFILAALILALALCCMGWGIFLTLRIFNIPDITTDGSFTLGAALAAAHLSAGGHWTEAMLLAFTGGAVAGMITGFIHTRLRVNALLSGILVMTAAWSFNLHWMGRSNIPLIHSSNYFNLLGDGISDYSLAVITLIPLLVIVFLVLWYLLRSDVGLALRATGDAPQMAASMGVSTAGMKTAGLALANALTAVSGALVTQYQGFADISMGIGIVIFGLGSVMIGETLVALTGKSALWLRLLGVVAGCLLFRLVIALSLASGLDPNWLKALTAGVVLIFVSLPSWKLKLS
ncbi:MAG: ABC transporter permease [Bacteroidia bacterium]